MKRIIALLLSLVLALGGIPVYAAEANPFSVSKETVAPGEELTLSYTFPELDEGVLAAQINISYDSDAFTLTSPELSSEWLTDEGEGYINLQFVASDIENGDDFSKKSVDFVFTAKADAALGECKFTGGYQFYTASLAGYEKWDNSVTVTVEEVLEPVVIYSGTDWPVNNVYVSQITMTGAKVNYIDGNTIYLVPTTAKNATLSFEATEYKKSSRYDLSINWNGGSEDINTYSESLVDGSLDLSVYVKKIAGAGTKPSSTKTFYFRIAEENKTPVLASGYSATAEASVTSGETYSLNLNEVFYDADGDALSYTVSVDGAAAVAASAEYSYLNAIPGTYVLKFTATDGKTAADAMPTYTVTLTVKNSATTYDVNVTLPKGVAPKFYAVNEVSGGAVVKGDELVFENGAVKVPVNISRIMWEADGFVSASVPVSENAEITIVKTTFAAKLAAGEKDENAAIEITDAAGVKITGKANDVYLLPVASGFTYKATASVSGYNPVTLTEQTPTSGEVEITFIQKHFTVIAPKGSVVSAGTASGSFAYSFAAPISSETVGETVVYKFAPLSGNAFVRVQHPDKDAVTYWDWKSSKADGKSITVTEEMIFMNDKGTEDEYNSDTIYRYFEKFEMDLGDIYMNINNQGYVNLNVGDTKGLNMFRNWQPIESYINSKISIPDFEYEIITIEGEKVITITPDANNSAAATLKATGEGTAIVLVTYDAMYSDSTVANASGSAGDGNRYSAIWPDRTGVFVVSVGKDGTSINSNMTCNGAVFDAEHSPQFYVGDEGAAVSFIPDEGVTVTVNRSTVGKETLSFGEFTSEGVSVNAETGEVTVSGLKTGRHIIKFEKDGVASYQVVTATQVSAVMKNSEGNEIPFNTKLNPGETVTITVTGLTNPAEKFATKYNFNAQITYKDQFGNAYANSSGSGIGQYNFSSQPQTITVTIPEDWTNGKMVLNGYIQMGGYAGDGIGSHRKVSYGVGSGMANGVDAGMVLGTLPELVINVKSAECEHQWKEATCTDPKVCELCGETIGEPLGHDWKDATCEAPKTCFVCGETEGEANPDAHSYKNGKCEYCEAAEPMPFIINVNGEPVIVTNLGTTVECNKLYYRAKQCEVTVPAGTTSVSVKGVNGVLTVYFNHGSSTFPNPTNEVNYNLVSGKDNFICIRDTAGSGDWYHVAIKFAPCNHQWTDADCNIPKTCSICGVTEGDALGHDEITHEAKAPTCTEIGWDAYVTCSRCDYSTYVEKPALEHDEIAHEAKAPTCTEIGWDAYVTCSRCDYSTYVEKPALDHDEIAHEAKAPTCTEIGWDAYVTCSRCDYSTYEEKAALKHDEINHEAKAPTCTEIGWDAYVTCSRCDYNTYEEKAALKHDEINHEAKAPTCTEIGWDAYVTCSRCDYSTYEEKAAIDHNWEVSYEWAENGLSCTATRACKNDQNHNVTVNATVTGVVAKDPTCCTMGDTQYKAEFAVDWAETQYTVRTDIAIDEDAHEWGEWKTVKEPTYYEYGLKERECGLCGDKEQDEIDKLVKPTQPSKPSNKPSTGITVIIPGDKGEEKNPNTGAPVFDLTAAGFVVLAATAVVLDIKRRK